MQYYLTAQSGSDCLSQALVSLQYASPFWKKDSNVSGSNLYYFASILFPLIDFHVRVRSFQLPQVEQFDRLAVNSLLRRHPLARWLPELPERPQQWSRLPQ